MKSVFSDEKATAKPAFRRSIVNGLPEFYRTEIEKAAAAGDCTIIHDEVRA